MAELPTLDPIPTAPEAPSRIEYGQNKAEFRPKANLFMDWMVTFSEWLNPYLEYIQALYASVRTDTQTVADDKAIVAEDKATTIQAKNDAETARDEAQNIADGITADLPDGTISDNTIGTDTAWSSDKINAEIKTLSSQLVYNAEGKLIEMIYTDGAKEILSYNAEGKLGTIQYTETDGTTIRYTQTLVRDVNGKLIEVQRS